MPPLIRFVVTNFSTGAAIGWLFTAALLWIDRGGLGLMLERSPDGAVAALLLAIGSGGSFGLGYLATALAFDPGTE